LSAKNLPSKQLMRLSKQQQQQLKMGHQSMPSPETMSFGSSSSSNGSPIDAIARDNELRQQQQQQWQHAASCRSNMQQFGFCVAHKTWRFGKTALQRRRKQQKKNHNKSIAGRRKLGHVMFVNLWLLTGAQAINTQFIRQIFWGQEITYTYVWSC